MITFTDLINFILEKLDPSVEQKQHIVTILQRRNRGSIHGFPFQATIVDTHNRLNELARVRMSTEAVEYLLNVWVDAGDTATLNQNLQNSFDEFRATFGDKKVDETEVKKLFLGETAAHVIELVQQFGTYFARNTDLHYRAIIARNNERREKLGAGDIFSVVFVLLLALCTYCATMLDGKIELPTSKTGVCLVVSCIASLALRLWFVTEHFHGDDKNDIDRTLRNATMALTSDIYEKNFDDAFARFFAHRPDILSYQSIIKNQEMLRVLTEFLTNSLGSDIISLLLQFTLSPYEINALNAWCDFLHENRSRMEAEEKLEEKRELSAEPFGNEQTENKPPLIFKKSRDKKGAVTVTAYPNNQNSPVEDTTSLEDLLTNNDAAKENPPEKKAT
jgi:hypothetical protein